MKISNITIISILAILGAVRTRAFLAVLKKITAKFCPDPSFWSVLLQNETEVSEIALFSFITFILLIMVARNRL